MLLDAPVNCFQTFTFQVVVGLAEVFAAEEPSVCGKGTGVGGGENEMTTIGGHKVLFFNGKAAP